MSSTPTEQAGEFPPKKGSKKGEREKKVKAKTGTLKGYDPVAKITKDVKAASVTLGRAEARFLVDRFYMAQDDRKRSGNQFDALEGSGEPNVVIAWLYEQDHAMEKQIYRALDAYSGAHPVGTWAREIVGIGPIISAALLAYIDLEPWICAKVAGDQAAQDNAFAKPCRASSPHGPACHYMRIETVGHTWAFAGLDPTKKWEKGHRRPWNSLLKVLCWKIGESFVKSSGSEGSYYGPIYHARKEYENKKNEAGDYADQARRSLEEKNFRDGTKAKEFYDKGQLPPARIHLRCARYAVKLFLSHWHEVAYVTTFGRLPPRPYALTHLGHVHEVLVPNMPPKVRELRIAAGLPVP